MKKLAALLQTVLFITIASAAYSQSLEELARKEKERRQEVQDEKVITSEEAARFRSEAPIPDDSDQPSAVNPDSEKKAAKGSEDQGKPESDEPVDFQGRGESYWRETMADARQKVKDLENEANTIILRLNQLQNEFYAEDNGFKREGIQRDIQKSIYEQDRNKEELAKAKDVLQDLEKEARKSGALPGWLSPKNK